MWVSRADGTEGDMRSVRQIGPHPLMISPGAGATDGIGVPARQNGTNQCRASEAPFPGSRMTPLRNAPPIGVVVPAEAHPVVGHPS